MANSQEEKLNNNQIEEAFNEAERLGRQYSDEGKFDLAVEEYKKALKYFPTHVQIMGELCWCLGQIDRPEEMLEWAKKALLISQKRISKDNIGRFYFYISQYYKLTKQFEKAVQYLILAQANKPYFMNIYIEMAYCKRRLGDSLKAVELYEFVRRKDEDYAKEIGLDELEAEARADSKMEHRELIHMYLGIEQEKRGELELANKSFYSALERNPTHSPSIFLLFMNEIKLKSDNFKIISIGEQLFMLLKKQDKMLEFYYMLYPLCKGLVECYKNIGNYEKEEFYLNEYKFYECVNKAKEAKRELDKEKAIEEYKKALEIKENNLEVLDELIDLSYELNQLDEGMDFAIDGLKQAKLIGDKNRIAKYQYDMGYRFEVSGYDKAVEYFIDAYNGTDNLDDKLRYCRRVALFYSGKDSDKTLEYLRKCQDVIKDGAVDVFDIESEIIKQEELKNKNSDLSRALDHYNIGAKYYNELNFEAAAKEMMIALDLLPQDLDTLDVLNRCLYKLERYNECYDIAYSGYLTSLRDHDYRFIDMFCYNLGNILFNSKQYEKALKYYKYASFYKPEDTDYLYFIAASYRNLGDYNKACMYFNKVVELDPDDSAAKEQFVLCYDKLHGEQ
ncbi:MAG: tetratricopeptide repeat protein [Candidatus Riflebacteria bacterium]|nr:tetratricopeptide repeat protein [Candidatus Riflebacteria bacterium]